jgi:hypothetical protein
MQEYHAADVSAAWIGVIGVLGGVALGAAVNLVADHFRWDREDERLERERLQALLERRRELCVELSTAADEVFSRAWSFIDLRNQSTKSWRADPYLQSLADALEGVTTALYRSYNELRILGMSARLTEAADRLLEVSGGAVNEAFSEDAEGWDDDERSAAGYGFLDAAQAEFGLAARRVRPQRVSGAAG